MKPTPIRATHTFKSIRCIASTVYCIYTPMCVYIYIYICMYMSITSCDIVLCYVNSILYDIVCPYIPLFVCIVVCCIYFLTVCILSSMCDGFVFCDYLVSASMTRFTGGLASLTLVVNATTCPALVNRLGITKTPEARRRRQP